MNLSTFEQLKSVRSDEMIVPSDEQLNQLHGILLSMLKDIDYWCEKSKITYMLSGGSVLGAMRHKGFIPWDDDIDIFMPRQDYNIFIREFAQAFDGKYWIDSPEFTPSVGIPIGRARLEGTEARLYNDMATDHDGIGIDIFVLENVPNNPVARKLHGYRCLAAGLFFSCRRFARDKEFYLNLAEGSPSLKRTTKLKIALGRLTSFWTVEKWAHHVVHVYSKCHESDSEYISCPSGRLHYFGEMYKRDDFLPPVKALFEDREFNLPHNPASYLRTLYGDWRRVPPESKRERHGYLRLDFGKYAQLNNALATTDTDKISRV